MAKIMQRIIAWLFNILFLVTPLIFFPKTSEIFEFNKIIFVYGMATVITGVWLSRCLVEGRFIFRRTILDYPLIGYLVVLIISTLTSIDLHTSIFGYYGRFNGGLLSILSYSLLYWAYVSNMDRKSSLNTVHCSLFTGAVVAIIAALEHFGIFTTCKLMGFSLTESCWKQDVQHRVFSTLGQPNWLAGYLVALLPISLAQMLNFKKTNIKFRVKSLAFAFLPASPAKLCLTFIFYVALLFTKSRSGLLGFTTASLVFWGILLFKNFKQSFKYFLILNSLFLILFTVFNPQLSTSNSAPTISSETVLEQGGTDSGTIRKLVWKGAINIWQTYPLLGTGPETFAYAYYQFRPVEHNLVSEWDFVYNKAHNEFLNHLANTGILGTLVYLAVIITSILIMIKQPALLAGYIGLLTVNLFNFSVVATQLQFFLFPAMAVALNTQHAKQSKLTKLNPMQILFIFCISITTYYILHTTYLYWIADYNYAKKTIDSTKKAIQIIPNEAIYHIQLANLYADAGKIEESAKEIETSINLSPSNVSLKRLGYTIYLKLSERDISFLLKAAKVLETAISQAPTNPKFIYNLGLLYYRVGQSDTAILLIEKAIELKSNYEEAKLALEYILTSEDLK